MTAIDESMLTGESTACYRKNVDDTVIGSTLTENGTITMIEQKLVGHCVGKDHLKLLKKLKVLKRLFTIGEIISGYSVPSLLVFALLIFIVWIYFSYTRGIRAALVA
ncbi:P-type ATPase [Staphylococcus aureus]